MHELVFYIAATWMTVLAGICIVLFTITRNGTIRVLLIDFITLLMVGILISLSAAERVPHFTDAALVLGLVSFVATLAGARFLGRGRIFE